MDCEEAREAHKAWAARVAFALGLGYRLAEGGCRRVLALWGFAGVSPFFRTFRDPYVCRLRTPDIRG